MPFSNSIAGGNGQLVRNQLQSDNFVTGVSGWRIQKSGNVEFNAGVFRSSLVVGPNPGAHIAIDATTDTLIDYDSGNNIIASISPTTQTISGINVPAGMAVYDPANVGNYIRMHLNQLEFFQQATTPTASPGLILPFGSPGLPILYLSSGSINGVVNQQALMRLVAENQTATQSAYVSVTQQLAGPGAPVTGQVMQLDGTASGFPFMFHPGSYTGSTDASGVATINHGCNFTPKGGVLFPNAPGAFANLTGGIDNTSFTSTQFKTNWHVANTGANYTLSGITFYALFWTN